MTLEEIKKQLNEEIKSGKIVPHGNWVNPTIGLERRGNAIAIYRTVNNKRKGMKFNVDKYNDEVVEIVRATLTKGFRCEHALRVDEEGDSYFNIYSKGVAHKVLVDAELADILVQRRWCMAKDGYCASVIDGKYTPMHRFIFSNLLNENIENRVIDHKNGNGLDNTLSNLRVVTPKENSNNRLSRTSKKNDPHGYPNIVGVRYNPDFESYIASARDRQANDVLKTFPIKTLGVEIAFLAAVNSRLEMEKEYGIEILQKREGLESLSRERIREAGFVVGHLEKMGVLVRRCRVGGLDVNGFIKVKGVCWKSGPKYYTVRWQKTVNGHLYKKQEHFSISKYGSSLAAYEAAIAKRKQYENEADEFIANQQVK